MPSWKKVILSGSNAALNSLTVSNGITGSLLGTSSYATQALSASYAPGAGASFPFTGSALITGSLGITGSLSITQGARIIGTLSQGSNTTASGNSSHAQGESTLASGQYSHAEGYLTTASQNNSHAEGRQTLASGNSSHAEGFLSTASGDYSHAEGVETRATQQYAHSEGYRTLSSGYASHTEGYNTTASGFFSHAEGGWYDFSEDIAYPGGKAIGAASHVEGIGTIAEGIGSHVQGKYNITSSVEGAFILGNGASDGSRSNLIHAAGSQVQVTGSVIATSFTGSLFGTASFTVSSSYATQALSASFATTASYVTQALSASFATTASYVTQALSASFATTASYITGQFFNTFSQSIAATTWSFNHNLSNKNPIVTVWNDADEVIIPEKIVGTSVNTATIYFPTPVSGYASATVGSILPTLTGDTVVTGSLRGQVSALSIASNTASLNLSVNNFFTITLANGANTHISASNLQAGQTVNIRVTQGSAGTGTLSFNSVIKQQSGSLYTGSLLANSVDLVSLITFDSSNAYISYINNFV